MDVVGMDVLGFLQPLVDKGRAKDDLVFWKHQCCQLGADVAGRQLALMQPVTSLTSCLSYPGRTC